MNQFDIGYVPEGWRRGDPLHVTAPPSCPGRVNYGTVTRKTTGYGPSQAASTFAVHYAGTEEEVKRVNAWLKWWRKAK